MMLGMEFQTDPFGARKLIPGLRYKFGFRKRWYQRFWNWLLVRLGFRKPQNATATLVRVSPTTGVATFDSIPDSVKPTDVIAP